MDFEKGEELQVKGICSIFNKIIRENFAKIEKVLPIYPGTGSLQDNKQK
jgi:hypothetical protein